MSMVQRPLVADRYRLVEPLGQGGMGRVWRARDEVLHRDVAIKEIVPPPGLTPGERQEMRERSLREARAIARLNHVNVVRIFDVLRTDGDPWIVMEYVPSRSLQDILATDGPLPPARVAEIGLGMLAALRSAHRAGVVHRDIKPGNVLLADDGRVVLTDWGLATVPGDPNVTRTGLVIGSPAYIAPERAREGIAGPRSDLWSLGATLFAAVEGTSPFARTTAIATLAALAADPVPQPKRAGPLKPVLEGLLRKDPANRINAEDADRLLRRAIGERVRSGRSFLDGVRRKRAFPPPVALPFPRSPVDEPKEPVEPVEAAAPVPSLPPAPVPSLPPAPGPPEPEESAPAQAPEPGPEPEPEPVPTPVVVPPQVSKVESTPPPVVSRPVKVVPPPPPRERKRGPLVVTAVALALVVLVMSVLLIVLREDDPGTSNAGGPGPSGSAPATADTDAPSNTAAPTSGSATGPTTGPTTAPTTPAQATAPARAAVPENWDTFEGWSGFRVPVPPGMTFRRDQTRAEFRDNKGRLLIIDQRDDPQPDPVADWRDQERTRLAAGRYEDYQRIRIAEVEYRGWKTADWEWTYTGNSGGRIHVLSRGFITGPEQAHGIYWSTPASQWESNLDDFRVIVDNFVPNPE
jgi:serine/threonine protein kinase